MATLNTFSYNLDGDETGVNLKGRRLPLTTATRPCSTFSCRIAGTRATTTRSTSRRTASRPNRQRLHDQRHRGPSEALDFTFSAADAIALLGSGSVRLGYRDGPGRRRQRHDHGRLPSGVRAVTLLEQTSATTYSYAEDPYFHRGRLEQRGGDGLRSSRTGRWPPLKGQIVAVADGAAVFDNVPQVTNVPAGAGNLHYWRHFRLFVLGYPGDDAHLESGRLLRHAAGQRLDLSGHPAPCPPPTPSSTVTVGYSGSGTPSIALLQQTDATAYDPAGNDVSDIDGMGRRTGGRF